VRTRHLVVALALSVTAAGCGAADASLPAADAAPAEASAPSAGASAPSAGASDPSTEAADLTAVAAEADGRVAIDVRTPAEVAEGYLAGALLIDLQGPDFHAAIAELPRDEAYFVYCRSGNRSGQAIELMRELGFTDLVNGGAFDDLARAGLETTTS
jgi:phage shock protein E